MANMNARAGLFRYSAIVVVIVVIVIVVVVVG